METTVPDLTPAQFDGLDGFLNTPGPIVPYHPPIPGTASRQVPLDHTRLRAQVTAVLRQSPYGPSQTRR